MLTTLDPRNIHTLPLDNTEQATLIKTLSEPFGDIEEAAKCWQELGCKLVMLEAMDTIDSRVDEQHFVADLIDHPEFIDSLAGHWLLSLTITGQDGAGIYLMYRKGQLHDRPL
ncbi:MAG: hypothetical protein V7731_18195 [Amphritea sp.]